MVGVFRMNMRRESNECLEVGAIGVFGRWGRESELLPASVLRRKKGEVCGLVGCVGRFYGTGAEGRDNWARLVWGLPQLHFIDV